MTRSHVGLTSLGHLENIQREVRGVRRCRARLRRNVINWRQVGGLFVVRKSGGGEGGFSNMEGKKGGKGEGRLFEKNNPRIHNLGGRNKWAQQWKPYMCLRENSEQYNDWEPQKERELEEKEWRTLGR